MNRPLFLFPGCLITARLPFLEASARYALDRLEIEHSRFPGASCCVEPVGLRTVARDTWLASAARLLAVAEQEERDILTLCNGCFLSLREAAHQLEDRTVREDVNAVLRPLGREYHGRAEVHHLAGFVHGLGRDAVTDRIRRDLSDLKLVAHPGCHMVRPSEVLGVDRSFRPEVLGAIASWAGAEVVHTDDWPKCCGGGVGAVDEKLSFAILRDATAGLSGTAAKAILTPCPTCFVQFDLRQKDGLPVLHLAELLAWGLGADRERIGLRYHRIKVDLEP